MSYQDPYYTGHHATPTSPPPGTANTGYEFNPYANSGGNSYSGTQSPPSSFPGHAPKNSVSGPFAPYSDEPNTQHFNQYDPSFPPQGGAGHARNASFGQPQNVYYATGNNSFRNIKDYRSHYQGNMWTKGSRIGCFGRFFCCTLLIGIYIFLSVVAALALWLRPPSIEIGDPTPTDVNFGTSSLTIPMSLNISVDNPTYLNVEISNLSVDLTYPTNNTDVGNGTVSHINLKSNAETNFTLPIDINYVFADDPNFNVLLNIAQRCGIGGGSQQGLDVDADIHIKLRALSVPVSFTVSRSLHFDCPFNQDDINQIISVLGGLLGGAVSDLGS